MLRGVRSSEYGAKMNYVSVLLLAFLVLPNSLSIAQPPQAQRPPDGGTREVLISILIPSVPDAPFSATVSTEWIRQLADGTKVNGPVSLRDAILKHPDQFVNTMTEKMLTYALGRGLEYYDMPVVRGIVKDSAKNNYRFATIVMDIVKSTPFQMKVKS